MSSSPIRVGIAGLGRSGWGIHCRLIEPLSNLYDVVAVFDQSAERRGEAEERFGCTSYDSYEKLLADKNVEMIVVAMPSQLHASCSIQALEAGKHVICEKPMAGNIADAEAMIAARDSSGKKLSIFQNYRYHQGFQKVQSIIDSGVLGRIAHIRIAFHGFARRWDWQTLKKFDGGSMNNTGPHPLDWALLLFGEATPNVACWRDKTLTLGDADDHVKVVLSAEGSPTVEVEVTSACAYAQDRWSVWGTQGGLTGSDTNLRWKYFQPEDLEQHEVIEDPMDARGYCREELPMQEYTWSCQANWAWHDEDYYRDMYKSIREDAPIQVTAESVLRQMEVMHQARELAPV